MQEPEILFEELTGSHGSVGLITLNRPKMLNALNQAMCIALQEKLTAWENAAHIKAVVIRGAGDRAFCAGGDIRTVYDNRELPIPERCFFWYEYRLNRHIHHYTKPYIALLDGITMGGGVGLSINGSFRVGTEKLKFSMPETGIGFFPDVGGSYFLPRFSGKMGWYLGLTGAIISAADAQYAGAINYQILSEKIPALLDALTNTLWSADLYASTKEALTAFSIQSELANLAQHREIIDHCFAQTSVEEIINALKQQTNSWCNEVVATLLTRSPTSLKVTLEELNRGAKQNFDECIRMEYRIALHFLQQKDFYEGIRAAVVDKDRNPAWHPKNLADVSPKDVNEYFDNEVELTLERNSLLVE